MPVTLSIKNVPDDLAAALRTQAERNHRSLQGELLAIVEAAVQPPQRLAPRALLERARRLGVQGPSESAAIVREMRDRRYGDD